PPMPPTDWATRPKLYSPCVEIEPSLRALTWPPAPPRAPGVPEVKAPLAPLPPAPPALCRMTAVELLPFVVIVPRLAKVAFPPSPAFEGQPPLLLACPPFPPSELADRAGASAPLMSILEL